MERGKGRIVASLWKPKRADAKAKLTGVLRMSGIEYYVSLVKNRKRDGHPNDADYILIANPKSDRDAHDDARTDRERRDEGTGNGW